METYLNSIVWSQCFLLTEMYGYCTQSDNWGCAREGKHGILPPVMSGRIRTKGKFSFRYGRMEIEAKMPVGDWLWPGKETRHHVLCYTGIYIYVIISLIIDRNFVSPSIRHTLNIQVLSKNPDLNMLLMKCFVLMY